MKVRLCSFIVVAGFAFAALAGCGDKAADTESDGAGGGATAASAPTASSSSGGGAAPAAGTAASAAVTLAHPEGGIKVGDKAVCVVCNVKEGSTEAEEVKTVLNYQGKTYAFCNEAEKAEFISEPAKYAQASAGAAPAK